MHLKDANPDLDFKLLQKHLRKVKELLLIFPGDFRRVTIRMAPGDPIVTEEPQIPLPKGRSINLLRFIDEFRPIVHNNLEHAPGPTTRFLKQFILKCWDLEVMQHNPILGVFSDVWKTDAFLEFKSLYQEEIKELLAQSTVWDMELPRNQEIGEALVKLSDEIGSQYSTGFAFKKTAKELLDEFKDLFEVYRYVVGFQLAMLDIRDENYKKGPHAYLADRFEVMDGVNRFIRQGGRNRKTPSPPLVKRLAKRYPTLNDFYSTALGYFARNIRNWMSHRQGQTLQVDINSGNYLIKINQFEEEFSLDELTQLVTGFYFLLRIVVPIAFHRLPMVQKFKLLDKLPIRDYTHPLVD